MKDVHTWKANMAVLACYMSCAQKESKHFITMETLDVAISRALENPVSYEFALKPNGEKVR